MSFKLDIELGNDAMQSAAHVAAALRKVADAVESRGLIPTPQGIHDENGNRVGSWHAGDPLVPSALHPRVEVYDYHIEVLGTWGRARKERRDTFLVLRVPRDADKAIEDCVALAEAKIAALGPKAGLCWKLVKSPVTLERAGDERPDDVIEHHTLASGKLIAQGIVSQNGRI